MGMLSFKTFHNHDQRLNHLHEINLSTNMRKNKSNINITNLLVAHWSWAPIIFTFIDFCISIAKLYSDITLQFILETNSLDIIREQSANLNII